MAWRSGTIDKATPIDDSNVDQIEIESNRMDYAKYIVRDKNICGGQTVIAGTRVPLRTVLASLAEGDRVEDILAAFPTLTEEAVRAVIAFAAMAAEEDQPVPAVPALA
jgi:uncharacterized protein (DUF433 family)